MSILAGVVIGSALGFVVGFARRRTTRDGSERRGLDRPPR